MKLCPLDKGQPIAAAYIPDTELGPVWLRRQRFELSRLQIAYDIAYDTAYETMLATLAPAATALMQRSRQ